MRSVFENLDIQSQKLGNIDIIERPELEKIPEPVVKYTIPPEVDVIGVNAPKYDCCVQKIIDEMGRHVGNFNLQFILGNDKTPQDIVPYFPKYILYFRSGTIPGTPDPILANLNGFVSYYKGLGMPVWYYLDDYLLSSNNDSPIKLMASCDGIIVSTNALKNAILDRGITTPIAVMKTHMDVVTFDMLETMAGIKRPNEFTILYSSQGRIGIQLFYQIVQRMNENVEKYKHVHLIMLSHQVAQIRSIINNCRHVRKTYLEWVPLDMYYRVAMMADLIIAPSSIGDLDYMMPRELQQMWLNCKSAHKYTLAGAARVPCIASPIADYKEAIVHGKTGFVANTVDEWMEYIDLMIFDKTLREEIGTNARADVVANWDLQHRTAEFVDIITKDSKRSADSEPVAPNIVLDKHPKVLSYIPVHNGMNYIKECLDSLVSQSYPNHEIIVGDNASTDGTPDFVRDNYPQVKILQTSDYVEVANPLIRRAINESDCKFWLQIGHDDKLVPNYWELVLPYFQDNPKIGITRVGAWQFSDKNPEGMWWRPIPWINPLDIFFNNKVFVTSPARRELWDSIENGPWGGFDEKCFFADWDWWIQAVLLGWKWRTCKKPMFWYRRHPKAWSFNYDSTIDGPNYSYMKDKWMPELVKYGIRVTTMATRAQIEKAAEKSGILKLKIKETP